MTFMSNPSATQNLKHQWLLSSDRNSSDEGSIKVTSFEMPNPSSMKELITDRNFRDNLQRRMHDEKMDLNSNSKIKQMTNGIRHIA